MDTYGASLVGQFNSYRRLRFATHMEFFEHDRPGSVVFNREHRDSNVLIPPFATDAERTRILGLVPLRKRHRHFGSMRSSQALTQSVFGTIGVLGRLPLLAGILTECGRPAFGHRLDGATLELEKEIATLGEPTPTSIDAWLGGDYRVAIECKLSEVEFGTCSQTRPRTKGKTKLPPVCNGRYERQDGRASRCALTERDVRYWRHTRDLFGWDPDIDHDPCPLRLSYQLARNVMAVCLAADGSAARGHALVIYDQRNPAMGIDGNADLQWRAAQQAVHGSGLLRRVSWQSMMSQWPRDDVLDWLRAELGEKFGFRTNRGPVP